MNAGMDDDESRSWAPPGNPGRPSMPTLEMIEAGAREIRRKGYMFLPAGVPRRWLHMVARDAWLAMERVLKDGH